MPLITRVKNILLSPKQEWLVIAQEKTSVASMILTYLLPLAILSALAFFASFFILSGAFGFLYGLYYCIIFFIQLVVTVCLTALISNKLAPAFGSELNFTASMRLMIYAGTPVFVGSLLAVIPLLGWLGALAGAIYSIYLLYLGIPILKKTQLEKVPAYLAVIVVCMLVVYFLLQTILSQILFATYTWSSPRL